METYFRETTLKRLREIHEAVCSPDKKHYGLYQLCPKCEGEGFSPGTHYDGESVVLNRTCPVCNGHKLLVRPEIKPGE